MFISLSVSNDVDITGQVFNWQKVPESTYIATAPMPWVDGFVTWTKTEVSDNVRCCRYHKHNPDTFCPSNFGQPSAGQEAEEKCSKGRS